MLYRFIVLLVALAVSVSGHAGFWDELQKAAEVIDAVNQDGQTPASQQTSSYVNPADKQFEGWVRMWENKVTATAELQRYRDAIQQRNYFEFESMLKNTAGDFEARPGWNYGVYPDTKEQRIQQFSSCIAFEVSGDSRVSVASYDVLATQAFRAGELAYDAAQNCLRAFTQAVNTENRFFETIVQQKKDAELASKKKENQKNKSRVVNDTEVGFMGITLGMHYEDALAIVKKQICPDVKMQKTVYLDDVARYYHFPACLELQGMKADLLINSDKYVDEIRVFYHQYNEAVFKKLQKTLSDKYRTNYRFPKREYGLLAHTGDLRYEVYEQGRVLLTVGGDGIQSSMSVWYMTENAAAYKAMRAEIVKRVEEDAGNDGVHRKIDFDAF
ncbi:MAG: hypothetical protein KDI30_07460 [Pseudomonadales bacterium]|nr:hypothetical protein [Pseudomonadales bacterium]